MQHLNYSWSFIKGFDPSYLALTPIEATPIDLPHSAVKLPYHEFDETSYQDIFTYFLDFDLEEDLPVKFLHFDGVMVKCHPYLNGVDLGERVSMFFPLDYDISAIAKKKGNRLVVIVDGKEDPEIPPFGLIVDYLLFAGIYRKVRIDSYPSSYIDDIYVISDSLGNVKVEISKKGEKTSSLPWLRLLDKKGKEIFSTASASFKIDSPELWSVAHPVLYTLLIEYGGKEYRRKFGFRDFLFREDGFYFNGMKTPLFGLNRHQIYPYFGMAAPDDLQRDDLLTLKQTGINVIRTSHYGDDESFLDACDELGMLYINEVPGWQHIGESEEWRDNYFRFLESLVRKERHHTSLLAFGVRIDESKDDHDLYEKGNRLVHSLDPYHPSIGVRNVKDSECLEDIYGYNDFSTVDISHGLDDPRFIIGGKGKPKLITENNGHMFPTKPFDRQERQLEQALRHARVASDALIKPGLCGELSWCAFDYQTHAQFGSGDRICYHGVFDNFRNPKIAAFFYLSQGKEDYLEVVDSLNKGEANASANHPYVVFTNLDYVRFYRGDRLIGEFFPDFKAYPGLAHPPIFITDFIGDALHLEGYTHKELLLLSKALNSYGAKGNLSLLSGYEKASTMKLFAKHRLKWADLTDIFLDCLGNPKLGENFTIIGIKDNKEALRKVIGLSFAYHYEIKMKEVIANGPCFGAIRIAISKRDEYGSLARYSQDIGHLELIGPIENMGEDEFSLLGGQISLYIRGKPVRKPSKAKIRIRFGSTLIEKEIEVK